MTKHTCSKCSNFETVLQAQPQRIIATLEEEESLDATPVLHADEDLTTEEYVTLVYELHHVHLPALVDTGLVAFDPQADTVRRGPRFDENRSAETSSME